MILSQIDVLSFNYISCLHIVTSYQYFVHVSRGKNHQLVWLSMSLKLSTLKTDMKYQSLPLPLLQKNGQAVRLSTCNPNCIDTNWNCKITCTLVPIHHIVRFLQHSTIDIKLMKQEYNHAATHALQLISSHFSKCGSQVCFEFTPNCASITKIWILRGNFQSQLHKLLTKVTEILT